jgi:HEPN domain-containing protein
MSPDPSGAEPDPRVLEVRAWILRAEEDLRAGRHDLTASPPLLRDIAFHCQQCVEKSIKAFLVSREQPFRKTHNLTELGGAVARLEPALESLMRDASLMTEFAWIFRYPGDAPSIDRAEAERALELAARVLASMTEHLPPGWRGPQSPETMQA